MTAERKYADWGASNRNQSLLVNQRKFHVTKLAQVAKKTALIVLNDFIGFDSTSKKELNCGSSPTAVMSVIV